VRRKDYTEVHRIADRLEGEMATAVKKGAAEMAKNVTIDELANAISQGSVRKALALFPSAKETRQIFQPLGDLSRVGFFRGGRLAQKLFRAKFR